MVSAFDIDAEPNYRLCDLNVSYGRLPPRSADCEIASPFKYYRI